MFIVCMSCERLLGMGLHQKVPVPIFLNHFYTHIYYIQRNGNERRERERNAKKKGANLVCLLGLNI